jgi:small-conductance mechanosensitive channel
MNVALEALKSVPGMCPSVLQNPEPGVWYDGFGESGINMTIAVWFSPAKTGLGDVKNEVYRHLRSICRISVVRCTIDIIVRGTSGEQHSTNENYRSE